LPSKVAQEMKVCAKCGKKKPKNLDNFGPLVRRGKEGFQGRCKPCTVEDRKEKYARDLRVANGEEEKRVTFVPAAPFALWIKRRQYAYESLSQFCRTCELQERRVYDLIKGNSKRVSVDRVDTALVRDGTTMLWELYPELYE
jgi:hypothetical protein